MDRVWDKAWYRDVSVLWRHPTEFFPGPDQSSEERINALVRLLLYVSIAAFAYNRNAKTLVLGGAAIAVVSLAFSGAEPFPHAEVIQTAESRPGACTAPTKDNPFANMLLSDLAKDPNRSAACPYDSVKDDIRKHFNDGLIRNALDVYENENSQRQWYTMPVTNGIPDTGKFADFCYGNMKSCKSDQTQCVPR